MAFGISSAGEDRTKKTENFLCNKKYFCSQKASDSLIRLTTDIWVENWMFFSKTNYYGIKPQHFQNFPTSSFKYIN